METIAPISNRFDTNLHTQTKARLVSRCTFNPLESQDSFGSDDYNDDGDKLTVANQSKCVDAKG